MSNGKALVVEDNAANRELVVDLLEVAGFEVLTAENGEDGIAAAIAQQPDIILMDVALPGMDGFEATRRLKQAPRTSAIPVVAVTAQAMRGDDDRARAAGCVGYVSKPIDTRRFATIVAEFIAATRTPAGAPP